jgi:hypothetical protein
LDNSLDMNNDFQCLKEDMKIFTKLQPD